MTVKQEAILKSWIHECSMKFQAPQIKGATQAFLQYVDSHASDDEEALGEAMANFWTNLHYLGNFKDEKPYKRLWLKCAMDFKSL